MLKPHSNTIHEAYDYAVAILKGSGAEDISALTALHVLMNTIAKEIK